MNRRIRAGRASSWPRPWLCIAAVCTLCLSQAFDIGWAPRSAAAQSGGSVDSADWPDTHAGRLAEELFGLINEGTHDEIEAFIRRHYDADAWADFPPADNAGWIAGLKEVIGPLEFHGTREFPEFDENTVVAIAFAKKPEQWRAMSLTVAPEPPHKVVGMAIMPARAPEALNRGPSNVEEFGRELGAYLERMVEADQFSGSVRVTRNENVVFEGAYGLASRRYEVPNRVDTRFNLGSMNKMFTAVAVLQLEARGLLSLDDSVHAHLPAGWLEPEVTQRIRVRDLLSHTSGLGDYFSDERMWKGSRLSFREIEDYKVLFDAITLEFEPGTEWAYSNSGFLLLGVLIEKVSGTSYENYVQRHIYGPAGMTDTAFYEIDLPVPNLAIGYYADTEGPEPIFRANSLLHVVKGGPAGGGYSTVSDLQKFATALRSDLLLPASSRKKMWTVSALSQNRLPYGLGFSVGGSDGDRRVGHGGDFPGISANLDVHLDTGWTVAILCNQTESVGAGDLNIKIADWISKIR